MYSVATTKRFDKDLKRCQKRGLDLQLIFDAIALLRTTGTLPTKKAQRGLAPLRPAMKHGRLKTYSSADEMFKDLGINV